MGGLRGSPLGPVVSVWLTARSNTLHPEHAAHPTCVRVCLCVYAGVYLSVCVCERDLHSSPPVITADGQLIFAIEFPLPG